MGCKQGLVMAMLDEALPPIEHPEQWDSCTGCLQDVKDGLAHVQRKINDTEHLGFAQRRAVLITEFDDVTSSCPKIPNGRMTERLHQGVDPCEVLALLAEPEAHRDERTPGRCAPCVDLVGDFVIDAPVKRERDDLAHVAHLWDDKDLIDMTIGDSLWSSWWRAPLSVRCQD
jgi:hypothetical protein